MGILLMSDFLCLHRGWKWLHVDESIRYHSSGKCIPLDENNNRHDFRDCPKSSFNLRRQSEIRARAVTKTELKKIDDFALLADISDQIKHWNARLVNHELVLEVIPKNSPEELEKEAAKE